MRFECDIFLVCIMAFCGWNLRRIYDMFGEYECKGKCTEYTRIKGTCKCKQNTSSTYHGRCKIGFGGIKFK